MDQTRAIQSALDEEEASRLRELLAELGRQATAYRFDVAPNPCVGAAVLSDGVEIGRGFHQVWGQGHAEINALEAASKSGLPTVRWDTLVVTLEPCSTAGKTPPCVEAIVRAGIRRVVVGELDPDPRHRGRGLEELSNAGVEVVHLRGAAPLDVVAPYFRHWTSHDRLRRPRPWVIAKWAQTRSGQLRPPEHVGEGRWISGTEARAEVQRLRRRVDAIVTGVGTVLADDPSLGVRAPADPGHAPLRVVLDSRLRTPPDARLFQPPRPGEAVGRVHLLSLPGPDGARHRALQTAGATIHAIRPAEDGRPSLRAVSSWLWEAGVQRALLEAGPTLLESWFRAELVDQILVFTGNVIGGRGPSMAAVLDRARLASVLHSEVGGDARLDAFVKR